MDTLSGHSKNGIFKVKNSMLMNEINKTPGLQIGIIGKKSNQI